MRSFEYLWVSKSKQSELEWAYAAAPEVGDITGFAYPKAVMSYVISSPGNTPVPQAIIKAPVFAAATDTPPGDFSAILRGHPLR